MIKNHIYKQTHKEKSSDSNISIMEKEVLFDNKIKNNKETFQSVDNVFSLKVELYHFRLKNFKYYQGYFSPT